MTSSIQVAVRVRPFNSREKSFKSERVVHMPTAQATEVLVVRNGRILRDEIPRKFTFDFCFDSHTPPNSAPSTAVAAPVPAAAANAQPFASQETVYIHVGRGILQNALSGYNACLFAYGQTGSGKTYSMMGSPGDPGVTPRLVNELYERIEERVNGILSATVECSYLEIYNEHVKDLLNPRALDASLRVRQHPTMGVFVEGLTKLRAIAADDIVRMLEAGGQVRAVAATAMNATSSRSHAIFTLRLRCKTADNELASQLHLVDLAGSERADSTGATGDTLAEGSNINKSLTVLGMCLSRLADSVDKKPGSAGLHVPFRDSQLTWLLSDSLGGNSRTAMLANVSPADINCDETLSTLRFASVTKKIKTAAIINEDPQQRLIRELKAEIALIRDQIMAFESGGGGPSVPRLRLATRGGDDVDHQNGAATTTQATTQAELLRQLDENVKFIEELDETAEEQDTRATRDREQYERGMAELLNRVSDAAASPNSPPTTARRAAATAASAAACLPTLFVLNEELHRYKSDDGKRLAVTYRVPFGSVKCDVGSAEQCAIRLPSRVGGGGWVPVAAAVGVSNANEDTAPPAADVVAIPGVVFTLACDGDSRTLTLTAVAGNGVAQRAAAARTRDATVLDARRDVAGSHIDPSLTSAGDEGDDTFLASLSQRADVVWRNGTPLPSGTVVDLLDLDRIVVGPFAFRVSLPSSWLEFVVVEEPTSIAHAEALESRGRMRVESDAAESMVSAFRSSTPGLLAIRTADRRAADESEESATDPSASSTPAEVGAVESFDRSLESEARRCLCLLGARETQLCELYPFERSKVTMARFDASFAKGEREKYIADCFRLRGEVHQQRLQREEASKAALIENLQRQVRERQELVAQQAAAEEAAAAERKRQKQQQKKLQSPRQGPQDPPAALPPPVEPSPPPVDPSSSLDMASSIMFASFTAGESLQLLAVQVQQYEEACRTARAWKPCGPTDPVDRQEYDAFLAKPTLAAIRAKRDIVAESFSALKWRKGGLFRRYSFHSIVMLLTRKFLYYFDDAAPSSTPKGCLYVWGMQIFDSGCRDKVWSVELQPTAPRKAGAEGLKNRVLFGWPTKQQRDEFIEGKLRPLVLPVASPEVLSAVAGSGSNRRDDDDDDDEGASRITRGSAAAAPPPRSLGYLEDDDDD